MNIGTLVWHAYYGGLRFGTITGKKIDDKGWAHFTVDWHDDAIYDRAVKWMNKLRNTDDHKHLYRADELTPVSSGHLSRAITSHVAHTKFRTPVMPVC